MAVVQQSNAQLAFGDEFRVNDLSDDAKFKLSFECGEFFGPNDVRVKILANENRLLIEGSKMQTSRGVQVSRQITYEHELPGGVNAQKVKAHWDPNEDTLIVEAPFADEEA